jgi:hypothetical protein
MAGGACLRRGEPCRRSATASSLVWCHTSSDVWLVIALQPSDARTAEQSGGRVVVGLAGDIAGKSPPLDEIVGAAGLLAAGLPPLPESRPRVRRSRSN